MALLKANRTAVLTMSVLLAGCATVGPQGGSSVITQGGGLAGRGDAGKLAAADADAEPDIDFDGALLKAQTQRKMGDLAGAARTLSQMVLIAPDDPRVLGEYGKTLVAQGRSDDALAFLERAIELQSGEWTLYSAQGVAYDQRGDFRSAQSSYGRALALKPGEPSVMSNKALSHIQTGELDEAERLLHAAAEAGGDYPRIASNLALVQSLKSSRPSLAPLPAPEKLAGPAAASQPPAVSAAEPAPQEPKAIVPVPVESTPLTTEAVPSRAAEIPAPQPRAASAALRPASSDPTVRMQRVPVDPLAGPVAAKKTATAAKSSALKAGPQSVPGTAGMVLRPSLHTAQQASVTP
jgi:Flp pilus assembly protein TadD